MKRFIMVILAVLAFCTLVACGTDKNDEDKNSDSDSDANISVSTSKEELPPNSDITTESVVTSAPESEEPEVTSDTQDTSAPESTTSKASASESVTTSEETTTAVTTTTAQTTTVTTTAKKETSTESSISIDDDFADFPIVDASDDEDDYEDIIWEEVDPSDVPGYEDESVDIND